MNYNYNNPYSYSSGGSGGRLPPQGGNSYYNNSSGGGYGDSAWSGQQSRESSWGGPSARESSWRGPSRESSWGGPPSRDYSWNAPPRESSWGGAPPRDSWGGTPRESSWGGNQTREYSSWQQGLARETSSSWGSPSSRPARPWQRPSSSGGPGQSSKSKKKKKYFSGRPTLLKSGRFDFHGAPVMGPIPKHPKPKPKPGQPRTRKKILLTSATLTRKEQRAKNVLESNEIWNQSPDGGPLDLKGGRRILTLHQKRELANSVKKIVARLKDGTATFADLPNKPIGTTDFFWRKFLRGHGIRKTKNAFQLFEEVTDDEMWEPRDKLNKYLYHSENALKVKKEALILPINMAYPNKKKYKSGKVKPPWVDFEKSWDLLYTAAEFPRVKLSKTDDIVKDLKEFTLTKNYMRVDCYSYRKGALVIRCLTEASRDTMKTKLLELTETKYNGNKVVFPEECPNSTYVLALIPEPEISEELMLKLLSAQNEIVTSSWELLFSGFVTESGYRVYRIGINESAALSISEKRHHYLFFGLQSVKMNFLPSHHLKDFEERVEALKQGKDAEKRDTEPMESNAGDESSGSEDEGKDKDNASKKEDNLKEEEEDFKLKDKKELDEDEEEHSEEHSDKKEEDNSEEREEEPLKEENLKETEEDSQGMEEEILKV